MEEDPELDNLGIASFKASEEAFYFNIKGKEVPGVDI